MATPGTYELTLDFGKRFRESILDDISRSTLRSLQPERIIFNNPATIVYWKDGTKTVVKCMDGDTFSEDIGFAAALAKKVYGGHNQYKKFIENAQRQSDEANA